MIHRISLFSNPRIFLPFFVAAALVVTGILLAALVNLTVGIIVLFVAGLLLNGLFRLVVPILKSSIEINNDSVISHTGYGKHDTFLFSELSDGGIVFAETGKKYVFLINPHNKRYISIPDEFSDFDKIVENIGSHIALTEYRYDGKTPINEFIENLSTQKIVSE